MIKLKNWLERTFDFKPPADLFPNILARLRGTPARLEELVKQAHPDNLTTRHLDSWSIQEQAGHLIDVEQLHLARMDDYAEGKDTLTPADVTGAKTFNKNYNERQIDEILEEFREARKALMNKLEVLKEEDIEKTAHHPRLDKPMRIVDMAHFVAEHDDHHLARIYELVRGYSW